MDRGNRYPLLLGACAVSLIAACAQPGPGGDAKTATVAPVYRVQQPAGTAAGQYAVGRLDLAEGRIDAALKRFRQALQLDPNYVEALNGLGVAQGQLGRYDEAVEAFRSALASGPESAHVLNNLGFAQLKAGRLDEASMSLQRSLRLDADNQRTRENLALLAQARQHAALAAAPVSREVPAAAPARPEAAAPAPSTDAPTAQALSAAQALPAPVQPVTVQPVRVPSIETAASQQSPASVDWTARVVSATQSIAATVSNRTNSTPAYEVVHSRSADATLVEVSPNVYQLDLASKAVTAAPRDPAPTVAASMPAGPAALASRLAPARSSLSKLDGFEVSNGAGIRRLASRTAHQLTRFGADIARVTNYRTFDRRFTEIQYRDGHLAGARAVQERLPVGAKLVRTGSMHPQVNVRLVLGRDMVIDHVAWWYDNARDAEAVATTPAPAQASTPAPAPAAIAIPRGIDLGSYAATIARADVDDGWRHL